MPKIIATKNNLSKSSPFSLVSFSTKDRVLAAALKLFVEQGYFNTNVSDISRESKCSIGSIYHSFKSKEGIALGLYDAGINSFREAIYNSVADLTDNKEILLTIVRSFMQFSEINRNLSYYLWMSRHDEFLATTVQHPTRVGFDSLGRKLTKTINCAVKENLIKKANATIIWCVLFGIPLAYVRDWLDGYNQVPPSQVADEIAKVSLKALAN